MAIYKATQNANIFVRVADGAAVSLDGAAGASQDLQAWLAAGNVPDPYVPPPPLDPIDSWDTITLKIAFAHENRVRALEGKAAVTVPQFKAAVKALLP